MEITLPDENYFLWFLSIFIEYDVTMGNAIIQLVGY